MDTMSLLIIILLAAVNTVSFILVGVDKNKSIAGNSRVPEVFFFFWAAAFGSLGVLLGMTTFRHKTRKWYFMLGVSLLLAEQLLLLYLLVNPRLEL